MSAIIDFYRGPLNHCSAVRQGECPMYPSCSEYSKQAFEKYGVFLGAMIASDRVMRCGREEHLLVGQEHRSTRPCREAYRTFISNRAPKPMKSKDPKTPMHFFQHHGYLTTVSPGSSARSTCIRGSKAASRSMEASPGRWPKWAVTSLSKILAFFWSGGAKRA